MFISVRFLFQKGQRLSGYSVKVQRPFVGWLIVERVPELYRRGVVQARLVGPDDKDLVPLLDEARVMSCGRKGMVIEGMTFRQRSAKHSYHDAQAWWCHAPPIDRPMIDHAARVKAGETAFCEREQTGQVDDFG